MYMEGAQLAGHHRFLQRFNTSTSTSASASASTACPHCVQHGQRGHGHHAAHRQTVHPSLDCRGHVQAPRFEDVGGHALAVDGVERSSHRSPQRRPVFVGLGLHSQTDQLCQVCPWEHNPAQWNYPPASGDRHYLPVRERCGCMVRKGAGTPRIHSGIPHPLPHLQVGSQGYRHRRTVRYVTVEEENCGCSHKNYHLEPYSPHLGHLYIPNGHCAPKTVIFEGGDQRDSHQEQSWLRGVSEECCPGHGGSHKGFFPTEVPPKHLNQSRHRGPRVPTPGTASPEVSGWPVNGDHPGQGSEVAKQRTRQDSVRDQIRQVVMDLEDVLGGLKQVHVEMKEVVEHIDRLTARIDLSGEVPRITQGGSGDFHGSVPPCDLRLAPPPGPKNVPLNAPRHAEEDRIILRTNSPSPVHTAAVVKTSRFTPPGHAKDTAHERHGANGHPPHLCPSRDSNHSGHIPPERHPLNPDAKVTVGNGTSSLRTQKPPPYPQNGRCGNGPTSPSKPARTSVHQGRGRHNGSVV